MNCQNSMKIKLRSGADPACRSLCSMSRKCFVHMLVFERNSPNMNTPNYNLVAGISKHNTQHTTHNTQHTTPSTQPPVHSNQYMTRNEQFPLYSLTAQFPRRNGQCPGCQAYKIIYFPACSSEWFVLKHLLDPKSSTWFASQDFKHPNISRIKMLPFLMFPRSQLFNTRYFSKNEQSKTFKRPPSLHTLYTVQLTLYYIQHSERRRGADPEDAQPHTHTHTHTHTHREKKRDRDRETYTERQRQRQRCCACCAGRRAWRWSKRPPTTSRHTALWRKPWRRSRPDTRPCEGCRCEPHTPTSKDARP